MRRLYAALSTAAITDSAAAIREGLCLFSQFLGIVVLKGHRAPILDAVLSLPITRNLDVQMFADALNRGSSAPIDVSTGSHRTMSWITQRFTTADGAHHATLEVLFYWDRSRDTVLVRLEGDPEAMRMCSIDTLWNPADADYRTLPGTPLSLEAAIAAAADHV